MKNINWKYLIITLGLFSCEGVVGGSGYVFTTDKEPLDSVKVIIFLNDKVHDSTYSDNKGFFRGTEFVGCVPNCPEVKFKFKKAGFETKIFDFEKYWAETGQQPHLEDNLTILLTKD